MHIGRRCVQAEIQYPLSNRLELPMNPHLPSTHRKDLDLRPIRRELSKAGHVPGAIYTSEAIFQREIDTLFMQDWLYVGRIEELAAPGDYLTFRITGEPIIVARGNRQRAVRLLQHLRPSRGGGRLRPGQHKSLPVSLSRLDLRSARTPGGRGAYAGERRLRCRLLPPAGDPSRCLARQSVHLLQRKDTASSRLHKRIRKRLRVSTDGPVPAWLEDASGP